MISLRSMRGKGEDADGVVTKKPRERAVNGENLHLLQNKARFLSFFYLRNYFGRRKFVLMDGK